VISVNSIAVSAIYTTNSNTEFENLIESVARRILSRFWLPDSNQIVGDVYIKALFGNGEGFLL
jgi:hypothetical protein